MEPGFSHYKILFLLYFVLSITYVLPGQQLRFYHYTINDGLSQSSIKSVIEDNTGFIWLATQDGLNRFDSKNFKVWNRNKNSLSNNNLSQLIQVNDKIWIGTIGGGINVYNEESDSIQWLRKENTKFTLPDDNVNSLLLTSFGVIWAGCDNGIAVIDSSSLQVKTVINEFLVSPIVVTSLSEDKNKNIWVATRHDGVYIFENSGEKLINHISKTDLGLSSERVDIVRHLRCDENGRIWIATNKGLFKCKLASGKLLLEKVQL